jgi:hypothetical protein
LERRTDLIGWVSVTVFVGIERKVQAWASRLRVRIPDGDPITTIQGVAFGILPIRPTTRGWLEPHW